MGAGDFQVDGLRILNADGVEIAVVNDIRGARHFAIRFAHATSVMLSAINVIRAVRSFDAASGGAAKVLCAERINTYIKMLARGVDSYEAHSRARVPPAMN